MIGQDDVAVRIPSAVFEGCVDGNRVWQLESGDKLGIFFINLKPDLPCGLDRLAQLRSFFSRLATSGGAGLISADKTEIDSCAALKTIIKVPQQPHGMTYVASVTLPFRDFRFVFKTQCAEDAPTGLRDAVILDRMIQTGKVRLGPSEMEGWMADPYDSGLRPGFARNLSEDEQYDAMFPDHPLTRARRMLTLIEAGIALADLVRSAAPFAGPSAWRSWWPFRKT
jgi:hypothetical protein